MDGVNTTNEDRGKKKKKKKETQARKSWDHETEKRGPRHRKKKEKKIGPGNWNHASFQMK
jgi:hypothetical protein